MNDKRMSKLEAALCLKDKVVEVTTPRGTTEMGIVREVYDTSGIVMLRLELESGEIVSIHPTALVW